MKFQNTQKKFVDRESSLIPRKIKETWFPEIRLPNLR